MFKTEWKKRKLSLYAEIIKQTLRQVADGNKTSSTQGLLQIRPPLSLCCPLRSCQAWGTDFLLQLPLQKLTSCSCQESKWQAQQLSLGLFFSLAGRMPSEEGFVCIIRRAAKQSRELKVSQEEESGTWEQDKTRNSQVVETGSASMPPSEWRQVDSCNPGNS